MTGRVLFVAASPDAGRPPGLDGPFDVEVAEGAVDAVKRLDSGVSPPDCVVVHAAVSDLALEVLLERVRAAAPEVAVVVVGGLPATPSAAAGLVEADEYVPPGQEDTLGDRVRRTLDERRLDRAMARHDRLARAVAGVAVDVARAADRQAVEAAVYDRLTASDVYRQVWVGRLAADDAVEVTVPLALRLGETDIEDLAGDPSFVSRAVQRGEVVAADERAPTRGAAAVAATAAPVGDGGVDGGLATAVVPFVHDGRVRGVGLVSTSATHALDTAERDLLADLGAVVGHALAALEDGGDPGEGMGTLVHELRNPLGIALSHLEIAREDDDPESLERVEAALARVVDTIDRVSAGVGAGAEVELSTVELASAVEEAWGQLETPEASLEIVDSAPVAADRDMAVRLLANLLQNAVDHGGPAVTVRVGTLDDGFYVEDDGPGIPAEAREAVLERGYTTVEEGLGLGLSIVQGVAEAHGWTLSVGTADAGGARFEVTGVGRPEGDPGP